MFVSNEDVFLSLEANSQKSIRRPEHDLGLGRVSAHFALNLTGSFLEGHTSANSTVKISPVSQGSCQAFKVCVSCE